MRAAAVQLVAVEDDPPGGRHVQAGDAAADRGLAASRTRRRAQRTPGLDGERHAADGDGSGARPDRYSTSRPDTSRSGAPPAAAGLAARAPPGPASASSSSSQRTHRTECRAAASSSSGTAAWQRSCENAHRGANAHPAGHSPTPTATPGMPWSARGRRTSGMAPTSARVYGCRGRRDDLVDRPVLDDPAGVHDDDAVGHPGHDGEVVRDVDHRHPLLCPQPRELGEDAVLGQDVEPGGRLVEDRDRRAADARHRDRDTLLLAARELVRVAAAEARIGPQLDALERRAHRVVGRRLRAVRAQHVHDRVADPKRRVEGAARILGHVRDHPAAQAPHGARVAPDDRLPADLDRAASDDHARGACTRAGRARSWSCRCPTRRPGRGSRRALTEKLTSCTTASPVASPRHRFSTRITGPPPSPLTPPRSACPRHVRAAEAAGDRVAHQVHADREQGDHAAGASTAQMLSEMYSRFSLIMSAQSELGRLEAKAEVVDRGDDQDRVREPKARVDQHGGEDVRAAPRGRRRRRPARRGRRRPPRSPAPTPRASPCGRCG